MSSATPRPSTPSGLTFREGLLIVASFVTVTVIVVGLRLFCIGWIDGCLLGNGFCYEWRRRRRRRRPEEEQSPDEETANVDLNYILSRMSQQQRKSVIESILPYQVVAKEDLITWKDLERQKEETDTVDRQEPAESKAENSTIDTSLGETVCSICLHEIEVGNLFVSSSSCNHVFHRKCIIEWLGRNTGCPYCRSEMLTHDAVMRAIAVHSSP